MSRTTVDAILNEIEALGEEDRLQLEQQLAERLEAHWQAEVGRARVDAKSRGIDQAAIDLAIEHRRYGK